MKIHNEHLLKDFYKHDKLNVAILTDIYYPNIGGATVVVSNLAESFFKNKDVNVVVVTGDMNGFIDNSDFPVIRCKALKIPKVFGDYLPIPDLDNKFKKLMNELNIDIIHLHTVFGLCTYGFKFSKKHNIPIVIHGHSKFSEEYKTIVKSKFIYKKITKRAYKILNKTDLVLPVSEHTKQNYLTHGVTTQMIVTPNTTNLKLIEDNNNEIEKFFKEKYKISPHENILLFVGRLEMKCKNLDFLLKSLKLLKEKKFDFKMCIVGSGNDEKTLKKLCKTYNLNDNIIFVGEIKDKNLLSKFYYFSNLFLFPSTVDTSSLVKFEAATQKTPTLAILNSASAEGITNDFNGYTCELEENKFADKIIQIFSDKNKLKEISFNAYKTLNVGWDKVTKNLLELYKQLIENNQNKND